MFDHVTLRVGDRAAAEAFYDGVLGALGVEDTYRTDAVSTWDELTIVPESKGHGETGGVAITFAARVPGQVAAFRAAAGGGDHAHDPAGNRVDAVVAPEGRQAGRIIERLVVAVADVAAAVAFYATIAGAVGLRQTGEARFVSDAHGGELVLVHGAPSTGLHLAFPGDDAAVRRFHADAVAAGYRGNGAPGERPRYHRGYFSAYVFAPGGTNVEVVDHHRA